ncbi:MAG: 50S ribosomal protein L11 methyltransferase [Desulfohalobiaceae bacterium]|nr:50S ribosomal protein L11 methyltransferase [Desulfohalobiaceae bacterium]
MYIIQVLARTDFPDDLHLTLERLAPWGWEENRTTDQARAVIHCQQEEEARRIRRVLETTHPFLTVQTHQQEVKDWSTAWQDFFTPVHIHDKFIILPAWEQASPKPSRRIPLYIEPGMAFGTGHHPSTQLCLRALAELRDSGEVRPGSSFLDLGTGSGILGIAAVQMDLHGLGLDSDPVAVRNGTRNRSLNKAGDSLLLGTGDLDCLKQGLSFDLILANILSRPLIEMAPSLVSYLKPSGVLLLSGILREQEEKVIQAYRRQRSWCVKVLHQEEWSGLIFSRETR